MTFVLARKLGYDGTKRHDKESLGMTPFTCAWSRFCARIVAIILLINTLLVSPPVNALTDTQIPSVASEDQQLEAQTEEALAPISLQMAHAGDEGVGSTAQVLGTMNQHGAPSDPESLSESFWGNLILTMAYQKDPEIQRLLKKFRRMDNLVLTSVFGISALGFAQGIADLNDHKSETLPVVGNQVTIPGESKLPVYLGMVGSGISVLGLGTRSVLSRRYQRRITERQQVIKNRVEHILAHLETGEDPFIMHESLSTLVGERASREFLLLWQAVYCNHHDKQPLNTPQPGATHPSDNCS